MPDYHLRYHTVKEIISDIPQLTWSFGERSGDVKRIVITLGPDMGKEFTLPDLLAGGKRMLRVGREEDNDIALSETTTSYVSRYHFTLEMDKDAVTWYIRDGQWRMDLKQWVGSTNGTYVGSTKIGSDRTRLNVGDVVTVGDIKILIETN
jgi:pSer/pThr/pTyr-binding forkhead associated (FHA) protein